MFQIQSYLGPAYNNYANITYEITFAKLMLIV